MTSPASPFSDDELSLAIDGELDADRAALLEADPVARARRDALAAAAARVGTAVEPLDATAVDQLIAAALEAPLAPSAPPRTTRGPQPWLVAAAVVALVAVGLGLVWSGRGTQSDQASFQTVGNSISAADEATESGAGSGRDGAEEAAGSMAETAPEASTDTSSAPTTTAPGLPVLPDALALGEFASGDELREALADAFPASAQPTSAEVPSAAALERCATQLQVTLDLAGDPLRTGFATVDGRAVLVYEFEAPAFDDGQPTTLVAAVGSDACDQVAIFQR